MQLNKKTLTISIVLILAVFFMEYDTTDTDTNKRPPKTVQALSDNIFEMFHKIYDTNNTSSIYWGFKKTKTKQEEQNTTKSNQKTFNVTKKKNENLLCIEESCYRLLGIYSKSENSYITLYNKKLKNKINSYKEKETLEKSIIVATINTHDVLFADTNTSRQWKFEIFDVNATAYKPKEPKQ